MASLFDTIARFFSTVIFWATVQPWEQAIRVRAGRHVKRLAPGLHLRIPIIDVVHTQSVRQRTCLVPTQTLSTRDGANVVISATLGYAIADIDLLYRTLHHAEDTLIQVAAAQIAAHVTRLDRGEIKPEQVSAVVTEALSARFAAFGISEVTARITDFAFVRAFRLVQDQRWSTSGGDALRTGSVHA